MKTVIIDNEPTIVEGLKQMLKKYCPEVELIATASSVETGTHLLLALENVDLVFLDVELDDGKGMDVLKQLPHRDFQVIFITAYEKYAIDAFRFSAIEFLLKPFDPDDLIQALDKAKQQQRMEQLDVQISVLSDNLENISTQARKIIIKNQDNIHILQLQEILFLAAVGGYTKVHTHDGKSILSSKHLKYFEELMNNQGFLRVHHSYLVNMYHVSRFNRSDSILVLEKNQVPVSHRRREVLLSYLDQMEL